MHDRPVTPLPNPALVTRDAARRLPRLALLAFCAAYILPGLFGRDPWRGADLTAFGQMLGMAEGRVSWLLPALGGVPTDASLLPNWIGAISIAALTPWLDAAVAARLPFALLLVLTLTAVWYACFNLAQTEAAHKSHCPRGQAVRRRQKAGAEKADTKLAQKLAALDALVMATAHAPADDSRESLYAERGL